MAFSPRDVRDEMPSVTATTYLNAGTFGPMPRTVARAMHRRVDTALAEGRIGTGAYFGYLEIQESVRGRFARAVSAPTATIALQHSTTDGVNVVLSAFPFERGDEIITTTHEHPGLLDPLEEVARHLGLRVHWVDPSVEAVTNALTERTRLVALSHVLWSNGTVLPVREIADRVHARGVELLVDGAQSAGALAIDVPASGADYYTLSGQKWFSGPSGTGALYVRESRLARLRTPWPTYFSRSHDAKGVREWPDARRLDATTLSTTALVGADAALRFHEEVRAEGALEYAHELAESVRARIRAMPSLRLVPAVDPKNLVSFTVHGRDASTVVRALDRERILVRSIPGLDCVRASIGYWNDAADIDRLFDALATVGAG